VYSAIAQGVIDGTYTPGFDYFDADTGGLGLYGFMEGDELTPGVASLPPEVIQHVRDTMAEMLAGTFTRFDVFKGPISDNKGNVVLADGVSLEQFDLDQFKEWNPDVQTGMYWWAEGVSAELPSLE
jgi:hypothetical protein